MADILLIHGSAHGAWCWRDLLPELEALGHRATAIDLPSHGDDPTPVNDVTLDLYARGIVAAAKPGTVLVGHSMAGYAIVAAAEAAPGHFAKLIHLCSYVPAAGATLAQMRYRAPRQPVLAAVRKADDGASFTVDPDMAPDLFYHDCPEAAVSYALPRLCPQAVAPSNTVVPLTTASQQVPRHYIRCMDDRTNPPEFQVTMTEDWPDTAVSEMDCGHSPFFADPAGLARHINVAIGG